MSEPLKWYDTAPTIRHGFRALADVRRTGTLEGYCYQHVQAIMLAIDQYAETALGNREFFLNRPHGIGGKKRQRPVGGGPDIMG
jgi:hypothetical protein